MNSLALGVGAAGLGTILFALLAWTIVRTKVWGRGALGVLVWLPWSIPGLLLGIAFLTMILATPMLSVFYGTMVPLVVAMIVRELPIGVQMLRTSIEQVSGELEEAASMSGVGFLKTFRRITLPLISPMCVSVFVLVFMATVRDIGTVVLLAAPGTRTLPLLLFEYASSARMESAAVIGVLIATLSLAVVSLAMRFGLKIR
jgi:iron(III) transport system permease protein